MSWDKVTTIDLMTKGLKWEQARMVVGIIAEQKQIADREGYKRGFDQGYIEGQKSMKRCNLLKP